MKKIFTIATYTILEAYHHHITRLCIVIFAAMFGASAFFGSVMIGSYEKVLCDGALATYQLAIFAMMLFFIVPFFTGTERKHLIATFVLTPISRFQFMGGVALGFLLLQSIMLASFYSTSLICMRMTTGIWFTHLFLAFCAVYIEGIALMAAALCASVVCSRTIASCAVIAFYIIGYTNSAWHQTVKATNCLAGWALQFVFHLLPDFNLLDIKQQIIYQVPFEAATWSLAVAYTLLYSTALVLIACFAFTRMRLW